MNQDVQIRHESKHYRPCNQYKHHFHHSHHRSLLDGRSVKVNECSNDLTYSMVTRKRLLLSSVESAPSFYIVIHSSQTGDTVLKNTYLSSRELFFPPYYQISNYYGFLCQVPCNVLHICNVYLKTEDPNSRSVQIISDWLRAAVSTFFLLYLSGTLLEF